MHAGTFTTLEDAIRHHIHPTDSLESYTGAHLDETYRELIMNDEAFIVEVKTFVSLNCLIVRVFQIAKSTRLWLFLSR